MHWRVKAVQKEFTQRAAFICTTLLTLDLFLYFPTDYTSDSTPNTEQPWPPSPPPHSLEKLWRRWIIRWLTIISIFFLTSLRDPPKGRCVSFFSFPLFSGVLEIWDEHTKGQMKYFMKLKIEGKECRAFFLQSDQKRLFDVFFLETKAQAVAAILSWLHFLYLSATDHSVLDRSELVKKTFHYISIWFSNLYPSFHYSG